MGIGILISLGVSLIGSYCLERNEILSEQEIYEIETCNVASETSFLNIEYVDDKRIYQYVVDTGENKKMIELDFSEVYIHEDDYIPRIRVQKWGKFKKNGIIYLFLTRVKIK